MTGTSALDIEELEHRAERGDADAQLLLEQEYRSRERPYGYYNWREYDWLKRAAEIGRAEALFEFAQLSEDCMGDFYEGEPWYRAAAEQGHAKACMVLADHYMVTNMDYPDAASPITEGAKWYRRGRELGQPHDPVCLSLQENCCPGGSGVGWLPNEHLVAVTDLSKPKEWIAKHIAKARSGDIVVQYCVACWCACRPDISRDLEQAYAWFRVASRDLGEKGFDDLGGGRNIPCLLSAP